MPKSLCRIAGRSANRTALRISNFANVSARASATQVLRSAGVPPSFSQEGRAGRPRSKLFPSAGFPAARHLKVAGDGGQVTGPPRNGTTLLVPSRFVHARLRLRDRSRTPNSLVAGNSHEY